jgi:hypothetical protein
MHSNQTGTQKHILRWYQFSLRTLLIFVTLFACVCSWFAVKMKEARRQKEAVVALEKLHACIMYDYEFDSSGKFIEGAAPPLRSGCESCLEGISSPT